MISQTDMQFHIPAGVDHHWAETTYFDVHVPEHGIHAWVYLVFRAGVGVMLSDVGIVDRMCDSPLDVSYVDTRNHVPLPERMELFTLPTGVSLDATAGPRDYRVDYIGDQDTELHLDVRGLMEPYDIHDPTMDPLAVEDSAGAVENSGFGSAYANHFDLTCRVTGTLRLRGRDHPVDCVSSMDHSWGPRAERGMRSFCWMNANFDGGTGADYALQASLAYDPFRIDEPHELKHGYALVDGRVRGAVGGRLEVVRDRCFMRRAELTVVDVDGREHHAVGVPITRHTWLPYALCMTPLQKLRWTTTDDRVGYGTVMESWPLDMCAGRGL